MCPSAQCPHTVLPASGSPGFRLHFSHNLTTCPRSRDPQVPGLQVTAPHHPAHADSAPSSCSQHQHLPKHPPVAALLWDEPAPPLTVAPRLRDTMLVAKRLVHAGGERATGAHGCCSQGRGAGVPRPRAPSTSPCPPDGPRKRPVGLMASWRLPCLPPELSWLKAPSPPSSSSA